MRAALHCIALQYAALHAPQELSGDDRHTDTITDLGSFQPCYIMGGVLDTIIQAQHGYLLVHVEQHASKYLVFVQTGLLSLLPALMTKDVVLTLAVHLFGTEVA